MLAYVSLCQVGVADGKGGFILGGVMCTLLTCYLARVFSTRYLSLSEIRETMACKKEEYVKGSGCEDIDVDVEVRGGGQTIGKDGISRQDITQ